ncbi:hypothetical protein AX16_007144 [Volvariella volvacea WC 439]|nr:hypothetical protein AX16_007144 [Volvariella volvacea WC 439]
MILESSDRLRFGVHSAYLSQYSRAFPPTNVIGPSKLEICTLPERSEELQLLMEFLHPGPLPNIRDVPIEILARLAEAAEKYLVYSAMQSCVLAMEMKENPLLVLSHAMKHGYTHLQDVACPLTIDKSLAEGDKYLSIDRSFRIWALWRDDYREVKRVIMDEKPDCNAPGALKFYDELVSMFEKEVSNSADGQCSLPIDLIIKSSDGKVLRYTQPTSVNTAEHFHLSAALVQSSARPALFLKDQRNLGSSAIAEPARKAPSEFGNRQPSHSPPHSDRNMSFLVGPISGALAAGGVYYGFSALIQTKIEQHQRDLHNLSLQLIKSPNFLHAPPPAATRIPEHTFTSVIQARWNTQVANLFAGFREWDQRVEDWGKKLLYGDPRSSPAASTKSESQ